LDEVISERITQIQSIPGVLTAAMVYHQVDNNNNEEYAP
jgi:nitrate reductase NapAB chaperone NapD